MLYVSFWKRQDYKDCIKVAASGLMMSKKNIKKLQCADTKVSKSIEKNNAKDVIYGL